MSDINAIIHRAGDQSRRIRALTALTLRLVEEHTEVTEKILQLQGHNDKEALRLARQDLALVQEHQRRVDKRLRYTFTRYEQTMQQLEKSGQLVKETRA